MITWHIRGYWCGPLVTVSTTDTHENFEKYVKQQKFIKGEDGIYRCGNSTIVIEKDEPGDIDTRKKAYLYCFTHALPTAQLMDEDGYVVASHGGENAEDAKAWFYHHKKDSGYIVEEVDQKLIEAHLYHGASIKTLPKGLVEAFRKNQIHKGVKKEVKV